MHEVVGSFLGRIEEIDAYVTMPGDEAREAAERALYSGGELGPLHGVPAGMQLIGRRFDETTVPAASAAFGRTRPWYGSYPPRSEQTSGTGSQKVRKRG